MNVITIGPVVYLGELEEFKKDNTIIIKNSICLGHVSNIEKKHFIQYLKNENLKKLDKDIKITGQGATYSIRELSDDQLLEFNFLKFKLQQASESALSELINRKFDELI